MAIELGLIPAIYRGRVKIEEHYRQKVRRHKVKAQEALRVDSHASMFPTARYRCKPL
jgi:hypothetical protein